MFVGLDESEDGMTSELVCSDDKINPLQAAPKISYDGNIYQNLVFVPGGCIPNPGTIPS